jgi:hypothetical protein
MNERKTSRKNKTNLVVNWPTNDEYFTIDSLSARNPDFVNITLRVRLQKAIEEDKSVAVIGRRNGGKGRPKLAFAMRPVHQAALDGAKADGIFLDDESKLIPVMEVNSTTNVDLTNTPVSVVSTTEVVSA